MQLFPNFIILCWCNVFLQYLWNYVVYRHLWQIVQDWCYASHFCSYNILYYICQRLFACVRVCDVIFYFSQKCHWRSQRRIWRSQGKDWRSQSTPNEVLPNKMFCQKKEEKVLWEKKSSVQKKSLVKWSSPNETSSNGVCQMKFRQIKCFFKKL